MRTPQPTTLMIVLRLKAAPFQAVIVVGITSGGEHSSPLLVTAECDPVGRLTVIALTGTSGVSRKSVVVIPRVIFVCPTRITRTPSPLRTRSRSGKAWPPCETSTAGPVIVPGSSGVTARTPPTNDPLGHEYG